MTEKRLSVRQGYTQIADERHAVADLYAQISMPDASLILCFCSPHYDLVALGRAFAETFAAPLVGCTTAGQIGEHGYVQGGITAVGLTSAELRATPYLIWPLTDSTQATEVGYQAVAQLLRNSSQKAFGLLLIDGLSNAEERITAALFEALGDVPLVGGSAADDPTSKGTFVYYEGEFRSGAAVFVLFETTLPFATFKVQHALPGPKKVVITGADAENRIVYEINGKPAAQEYARQVGVEFSALTPTACAEHPLLLSVGGEHFVRGIRAVNPDGSLSFACAVDEGLVLTIGEPSSALEALRAGFKGIESRVPAPALVLGFDSSSRRHEFEQRGEVQAIGQFLASHGVVGFCTYGEQIDSLHVNQTFTAVALGGG